jgi:hypothetical protein
MPSHNGQQRETKRRGPARREQGLVLDDFLAVTCDLRRDFKLRTPQFGLQQIEQYPGAREALKDLIQATIDRHGTEICSKTDPLLSEISADIYSEPIVHGGLLRLENFIQVDLSGAKETARRGTSDSRTTTGSRLQVRL